MIIDGHVHLYEKREGLSSGSDGSPEALVVELDAVGVDKAVLLPISPLITNDFVARVCRRHPDRFFGFASVDPNAPDAVTRLRDDLKIHIFKGLKLHPRIQRAGLTGKGVVQIVKEAAVLALPVLIDCFPQIDRDFPIEETFPERIGELAHQVPEAKIILAHAGGYKLWEAFQVAKANANIYVDFSFSPSFFRGSSLRTDLSFILRKLGPGKCIYGSDYPEISFGEALDDARQLVKEAGFSAEQEKLFFCGTLMSILPGA